MKKKILCAALLALMMSALFVSAALASESWYVYIDNGKTLNVRETPNGRIVGRLDYGAEVSVLNYARSGWSLIWYNNNDPRNLYDGQAYVDSRFLVKYPPAPYSPTPAPAPATGIEALNAEFRTAVPVAVPYTVAARPSRATGWVNLRWAPSTDAERIDICRQGKILIVLCEMRNWYQVQDPETGRVGFISRSFTVRQ